MVLAPPSPFTEPDAVAPPDEDGARSLGLTSATGLVVGSIIGTGVFTMPGVLAGAGTSSILVLGVVAVGAVLLGVMFGQLTKRAPSSDGGLYAYARFEFGDFAGYLTAWCYWITAWAGNAATVSSRVFYVESLLDMTDPSPWASLGIALLGLWIPAAVNLVGIRSCRVQRWFSRAVHPVGGSAREKSGPRSTWLPNTDGQGVLVGMLSSPLRSAMTNASLPVINGPRRVASLVNSIVAGW